MEFSEVVGFLVTMAAILYMFIKRAQDARKGPNYHDEGEEEEQEEKLKSFLKSLEGDMEESEEFKPLPKPKIEKPAYSNPLPKPKHVYQNEPIEDEFRFKSDLDGFRTRTNIDERKLKISIKDHQDSDFDHLVSPELRGEKTPGLIGYKRPSRIQVLLHSLPSKKDMVLLNEVFKPPKGM